MSITTVSVTTAATLIIDRNPNRIYLKIANTSANDVNIADTSTGLTTSSGMKITALIGEMESQPPTDDPSRFYTGPWYGIAGGTSVVRVLEIERARQ